MAKVDPAKAARRKANEEYPKDILYLVFSVVALAVIVNVYSVLWALWRRRQLRRAAAAGVTTTLDGKASMWRLPSAVLAASRIFAFRWRIPSVDMSVLEVLLTIGYTVATLIFTFVNTQGLQIKGYANRTGHIAAAHYPVIVALAMKNNVIGWFTGLSHEKLCLMHRVMSRVMLLQVWIHGWSRVKINPAGAVNEEWRIYGLVAGIAYTLMVLLSFAPLRQRFYEFFFIMHFLLALVNIVLSYYHASDPGFGVYIWPCFVIWGFDRAARALRTLLLADYSAPIHSPGTVEVLSHDTIRVSARRHVLGGWSAGQHMFLSFPTVAPRALSIAEGHPFTIATIPASTESDKGGKDLVFIMRVRSGLTRRLYAMAVERDGHYDLPLFMNGPYGAPATLAPHSTCIFIAGGSGVTYTLPRMRELLLNIANGKAVANRVIFVWAVRKRSHVGWLATELRKAIASAPSSVSLTVAVYVSGGAAPPPEETTGVPGVAYDVESGSFDGTDEKRRSATASLDEKTPSGSVDEKHGADADVEGVEIHAGRPDIPRIIEDAVKASSGGVSVDVSGPESLVNSVRSATSHGVASPLAVLRGAPNIVLNVETFSM